MYRQIIRLDRKFRRPRVWSNHELSRFGHLFQGAIINVSAWKDSDKQGSHYSSYFPNAQTYVISNYDGPRGLSDGPVGSLEIDLSIPLGSQNRRKFDVVFNHTTLEHIYEFRTAFQNLCLLSKDIVIIVVPFLQEQHGDYGDYWRFTPSAVVKLFEENDFSTLYVSCNDSPNQSIYVFAIGSRKPQRWQHFFEPSSTSLMQAEGVGGGLVGQNLILRVILAFRRFWRLVTKSSDV